MASKGESKDVLIEGKERLHVLRDKKDGSNLAMRHEQSSCAGS